MITPLMYLQDRNAGQERRFPVAIMRSCLDSWVIGVFHSRWTRAAQLARHPRVRRHFAEF